MKSLAGLGLTILGFAGLIVATTFDSAWWLLVTAAAVVAAIIRHKQRGRQPVDWPGASTGVAMVRDTNAGKVKRDGTTVVRIDVTVERPDRAPFDSVLTRRLPASSVVQIQPGLRFPVMYRPARPEKVKIARGAAMDRAWPFYEHVMQREGLSAGPRPIPAQAAAAARPPGSRRVIFSDSDQPSPGWAVALDFGGDSDRAGTNNNNNNNNNNNG